MVWARSAAVTALVFLLGAGAGHSASAHTIAVRRPDGTDGVLVEAFSRLCGELGMYNLEVRLIDGAHDVSSADPSAADAAPISDVAGGVSFFRASGQASALIWIAATATRKEIVRLTISVGDADAPSLLAIRAADLLRASLKDQDQGSPPHVSAARGRNDSAIEAAGSIPPTRSAADAPPAWTVHAGASALWETAKLGLGLAPSVRADRSFGQRWRLTLELIGPVVGHTYGNDAATMHLREEIGIVAGGLRLIARGRLTLELVQGVGAARFSVHGEATPPWSAQDSSVVAAVSSTGVRFGLRFSRRVGASASLAAVFVVPRPVLDVADASYPAAQPLVLSSLGLDVGF